MDDWFLVIRALRDGIAHEPQRFVDLSSSAESDRLPHLSEREQEPRPGPTNLLAGLSREAVVGGGAGLTQGKDVLELGDRLADLSFWCRESREIKSRQQARLIQRSSPLVGADPMSGPAGPRHRRRSTCTRSLDIRGSRTCGRLNVFADAGAASALSFRSTQAAATISRPVRRRCRCGCFCASGGSPFRAEHGGDQSGLDACATTEADVQGRDGRGNDRRACLPLLRA